MRIGLLIICITAFLIINTYYDGKFTKMFQINKKYIQMSMYFFIGLSLYTFIKKNPTNAGTMLNHANHIIKYMPIDKEAGDMISPILDFTNANEKMKSLYGGGITKFGEQITPQTKRMLNSGINTTKRSVSETKKKYVAAQQNWCCGKCKEQLKATFEVDHRVDLQYGGTNHISNLVALCVECHKEKTMQSIL
jgi:hypothetical protein